MSSTIRTADSALGCGLKLRRLPTDAAREVPAHRAHAPHPSEGGFTLTEVVVGAFVVLVVLAGFIYFSTSSSKTQSLASVRVRQTSVAKAIWERVNATSSWTTAPGCNVVNTTCTISPQFYGAAVRDLDIEMDDLVPSATAVGKDIAADGAADRNGAAPDVYELHVMVKHVAASGAIRTSTPVELVGTFDPTKAGSMASLTVQVCAMLGQTDERIRVNGCTAAPQTYRMEEPFGTSPTYEYELAAWEALDDLREEDGVDVDWMRNVVVQRPQIAGLEVSLDGPRHVGWTPLPASGAIRFEQLPAGLYSVNERGYRDHDLSRWEQGSSPVGTHVALSPGSAASSVVMLRNEGRRVKVGVSGAVAWTAEEAAARWVRLLPVPADRLGSPSWWRMDPGDARAQGWMPVSELLEGDTMKLQPGLYAAAAYSQMSAGPLEIVPVDVDVLTGGEYIGDVVWIDSRGSAHFLPAGEESLSIAFDGLEVLGDEGGA
jgi:Tfp pilus assembly protein PilV